MDTVVHLVASSRTPKLDVETFDALSEQFNDLFDGMLSSRGEDLLLTVYLPDSGVGTERAVLELITRIDASMDLDVLELDLDLVTVSDIAERTGRSRQSIRMLTDGSRGAGGFPSPLGLPGGSKVWDWSSVNAWLRQTSNLGDAEAGLARSLIYKINSLLAGRTQARA